MNHKKARNFVWDSDSNFRPQYHLNWILLFRSARPSYRAFDPVPSREHRNIVHYVLKSPSPQKINHFPVGRRPKFFLSTNFLTWNIQKCYQTYNAKGGDHIWPYLAIWMTKEMTFCDLNTRDEWVCGVLCLGSRAKKLLLGGLPSAVYVAVLPPSLMVFF